MIIDGQNIAKGILESLKKEIIQLKSKGIYPGLALIIAGNNHSSKIYAENKKRVCDEIGIYSEEYFLPKNISESELLSLIKKLNTNKSISGILAQLPLPAHINSELVAETINPLKDVDALNPVNMGKTIIGGATLPPCTPAGILEMLNYENISVSGKNCVIIGKSKIVGKPLSMLLLNKNATVTVCHTKTVNLKEFSKKADILICAIGKAKFITSDMVKKGCVAIDVGITRCAKGNLLGDIDFENVAPLCSYISPVPGGVGPMTVAMLMKNTVTAAKINL